MKLGLGMHPENWNDAHLKMARQLGCEAVNAWVPFGPGDGYWHEEQLVALKAQANRQGLELDGLENFHWEHMDHIILGEEGRDEQLENVCKTLQSLGNAGIRHMGYSFSVCGVQGYFSDAADGGNMAGRGFSAIRQFDEAKVDHTPPPNRRFWFKDEILRRSSEGTLPPVGEEEFWERYRYFLAAVLPTAEKYGVKLCAHPDDPPIPYLRGMYRPLHCLEGYRKLMRLVESPSNMIQFCQGTISTMRDVNIYAAIEEFASAGKIGYVHFRNTSATLPRYSETFVDNGYVDMPRALALYDKCGFTGMLMPDHTPRVESANWWETGMGYALGYIRGIMQTNSR